MGKILQFSPRDRAEITNEIHTNTYDSSKFDADRFENENDDENENEKLQFQNLGKSLASETLQVGSSKRLSNIHKFKQDREAIKREDALPGRPPSYKTTRVYTFASIISDFDLADTAVIRMIKKKSDSELPKLAVVQSNQMQNMKERDHSQVTRLGRTIFMSDYGFESWVSQQKDNPVESELIQLLADFFDPSDTVFH